MARYIPQSFFSALVALSLLAACNDKEKGPAVPETDEELAAKSSGDQTANPAATPPAVDVSGKYPDLPLSFRQGIVACEGKSQYYDLTTASCTETKLSSFSCVLDQLLTPDATVLTEALKGKLKEYIAANLEGFTLFACTETSENFELHFYKPTEDKVRSYNVKLVKPTP